MSGDTFERGQFVERPVGGTNGAQVGSSRLDFMYVSQAWPFKRSRYAIKVQVDGGWSEDNRRVAQTLIELARSIGGTDDEMEHLHISSLLSENNMEAYQPGVPVYWFFEVGLNGSVIYRYREAMRLVEEARELLI